MKEAKKTRRKRRHQRVRTKILGTTEIPRLCVFKSANHIYCQLVDDQKGKTLLRASDFEIKKTTKKETKEALTGKKATAFEVGKLMAKKALEKNIKKTVFDRGGFLYHGRVKALAEGAREGGLNF